MTGNQLDLFGKPLGYPTDPGFQNTDTSRDAARAIAPKAETLRGHVLDELRCRGRGTADEIATRMRVHFMSVRPRLTELARLDLVRDSRIRRRNVSGRFAIVWEINLDLVK